MHFGRRGALNLPIAAGEYAENVVRKDFTVTERLAIADAVRREIGNRQGQRTELVTEKSQVLSGRKTREVAAERAGFGSRETLRRAEKVVHGFGKAAQVDHKSASFAGTLLQLGDSTR